MLDCRARGDGIAEDEALDALDDLWTRLGGSSMPEVDQVIGEVRVDDDAEMARRIRARLEGNP